MQRRQFLKAAVQTGAAVSFTAMSYANIAGANEKVRVALVGCGNRGSAVSRLMSAVPDTAVCGGVRCLRHQRRSRRQIGSAVGAKRSRDFRKVLDRRDVDALLVATPDHWHATVAVLACRAGKDVYVEKPLAHNIKEGRAIVDAARKHNRVVQAGMQHRSSGALRAGAADCAKWRPRAGAVCPRLELREFVSRRHGQGGRFGSAARSSIGIFIWGRRRKCRSTRIGFWQSSARFGTTRAGFSPISARIGSIACTR